MDDFAKQYPPIRKPPIPEQPVSESAEQMALFRWAGFESGRYPALRLLYHIPNEGKRSQAAGARLKAEGLQAGVPDIHLPVPVGKWHGLYIELKAIGKYPTRLQRDWLEALYDSGYYAVACQGCSAAIRVILEYLENTIRE